MQPRNPQADQWVLTLVHGHCTTDPYLADPVKALTARRRKLRTLLEASPLLAQLETLAQSVTRDVHARSLLDALMQLKLVVWDEESDTVRLDAEAFVPRDQWAQMMGFLGDNVGDHLRAAVTNVMGHGSGPCWMTTRRNPA